MSGSTANPKASNLKAGEWVEVRSREEILATLDTAARHDNLPFMPEMLSCCGRKFRVSKRSDKTCDPAHTPWTIRRMKDSVHLEGVRCNGEGHGGCQAGCLIWWNEAWLKRSEPGVLPASSLQPSDSVSACAQPSNGGERILLASQTINAEGETVYSCQATEIRSFTSYMAWWDPRQYLRDIRSGNLQSGHSRGSISERILEFALAILQVVRAFVISIFTERRHLNYPAVESTGGRASSAALNLQPGELVQIRSKGEIMATLDADRRNRGLLFDGEMLRYCGGIYRVLQRVNHIIDEKTGKMISMKNSCIILEGVVCVSDFHRLCPRAIYPYWREEWLQRASLPAGNSADQFVEMSRKS